LTDYMDPFPQGTEVSQQFGDNPSNGVNGAGGHAGRDYAVPVGTPIRAAADGVIAAAQYFSSDYTANPWWYTPMGGLTIVLDAGNTEPTFGYAHCSQALVAAGQRVSQGDIIGLSGNSGTATTGPHCHVEWLPPGWDFQNGTYGRIMPQFTIYPTTETGKTMADIDYDLIHRFCNENGDRVINDTRAQISALGAQIAQHLGMDPDALAQALLKAGTVTITPKAAS